jgi:hypothetical protein
LGTVCVIDIEGQLWCWGYNDYGEIGVDSLELTITEPTRVALPGRVIDVKPHYRGHCARNDLGQTWCWGLYSRCLVPDEYHPIERAPVLSEYPPVDAFDGDRCVLFGDQWMCTGYDILGLDWCEFVEPVPGETFIGIGGVNFGLTTDGRLYSWADSNRHQLGRWNDTFPNIAGPVDSDLRFSFVTGQLTFTCALALEGRVYCWGQNFSGQVGTGTLDRIVQVPEEPVVGLTDVQQLTCGLFHSCVVDAGGAVSCWGSNASILDGPAHHTPIRIHW